MIVIDNSCDKDFPFRADSIVRFSQTCFSSIALTKFLTSNKLSFLDYSIFPFVRQYRNVDSKWFDELSFERVLDIYEKEKYDDRGQYRLSFVFRWKGSKVIFSSAGYL